MTTTETFRLEVRSFIESEWDPTRYTYERTHTTTAGGSPLGKWHAKLQEARLVAPQWPEEYGGRGLTMLEKLVVTEELIRAGAPPPSNAIAVGWAGPTILLYGTEEQKDRFLEPMLTGQDQWCQLFSEPGAGSDLAGLTTRADRDGDEFVINGQKIWTSGAVDSEWGILLARTDRDAQKHKGITYFLIEMNQPGIEVRPIKQMTGESEFCEVFFTDARVPASLVVGEINQGWRAAVATLMNERLSLSTGQGMLWGLGPAFAEFWRRATSEDVTDPIVRNRLAAAFIEDTVIGQLKQRSLAAALEGGIPGVEAATQKIISDRAGQTVMTLAVDMMGLDGLLWQSALDEDDQVFMSGYLFSRALTIGGGTEEVQKNILGERALGLPVEPRPDHAGVTGPST